MTTPVLDLYTPVRRAANCALVCIWALIAVGLSSQNLAQGELFGQLHFANKVGTIVDARVTFLDGNPVAAGYTAQLYGALAGTPLESLQPLLPTTTFYTEPPAREGYIHAVPLDVPGSRIGDLVVVIMRVYDGSSWEDSKCRGESAPIWVEALGHTSPPSNLIGLQPFSVNCIPEPRTWLVLLAGLPCILLFRNGRSRSFKCL